MKLTISIIWSFLVAFAFSALIHSTDSAIGSIGATFSFPNILSVLFISWFLILPILLCILSFRYRGWKGFFVTLFLISVVLGTFLAFAGSMAQKSDEIIVSILGMTGISVFVSGLGSFPHVIIMSRKLKSV